MGNYAHAWILVAFFFCDNGPEKPCNRIIDCIDYVTGIGNAHTPLFTSL